MKKNNEHSKADELKVDQEIQERIQNFKINLTLKLIPSMLKNSTLDEKGMNSLFIWLEQSLSLELGFFRRQQIYIIKSPQHKDCAERSTKHTIPLQKQQKPNPALVTKNQCYQLRLHFVFKTSRILFLPNCPPGTCWYRTPPGLLSQNTTQIILPLYHQHLSLELSSLSL